MSPEILPAEERKIRFEHFPGDFDILLRNDIYLPPCESDSNNCDGLVVLLRGVPGAGKTTLALQLAFYLACVQKYDGKQMLDGAYYSLEQNDYALKDKLSKMVAHQVRHINEMGEDKSFIEGMSDGLGRICAELSQSIETIIKKTGQTEKQMSKDIEATINDKKNDLLKSFSESEGMKLKFNPQIQELNNNAEMPIGPISLGKGVGVVSKLLKEAQLKSDQQQSVIVVDGFSTLSLPHRRILGVEQLFGLLRRRAQIGIVVYEPGSESEDEYLDHMADMVIRLREQPLKDSIDYSINEMNIVKSRYQNPARGWHQYKIRNWGLEFFPSIHFQVHRPNYMPYTYLNSHNELKHFSTVSEENRDLPEGEESISNRKSIIGGLIGETDEGSITALLGARGSFKSQLCIDFLAAGAYDDKHGLLLSLIDNFENLNKDLKCPRKRCDKADQGCKTGTCKKYLHLFHQRPGCITPAEFLYYIKKRLEAAETDDKKKIQRLVFWDLTQVDYRFPMFYDDSMFIPGLMDILKFKDATKKTYDAEKSLNRPLRSVIMGAANAKYTKAVSAMADNVIFCWQDKLVGDKTLPGIYEMENRNKQAVTGTLRDQLGIEWNRKGAKNHKHVLMVYVDRREKTSVSGQKNLYAFPIIDRELKLPGFDWKPSNFAVNENMMDAFLYKDDRIDKIYRQQGLQ